MVSEMDREIGRILDALEREGMRGNTLVVFASDNGGLSPGSAPAPMQSLADLAMTVFDRPMPLEGLEFVVANVFDGASDNAPLRGGKTGVSEGGVRVPASIGWPGRLEARTHQGFMTVSDVLPTLLDAIGAADRIPPDLDGRSQWAVLSGEVTSSEKPDYVVTGFEGLAIYRSPWKLIDPDEPRLYQIYDDPMETRDRAAEHPEIVETPVESRGRLAPRPRHRLVPHRHLPGSGSLRRKNRRTGSPGPTWRGSAPVGAPATNHPMRRGFCGSRRRARAPSSFPRLRGRSSA